MRETEHFGSRVAVPPLAEPRANVFRAGATLPRSVTRVAVLPLAVKGTSESLATGREVLEGLLPMELQRLERFEFVQVTPEQLREWTGRVSWGADDVLPENFLKQIEERLDCEAVLFPRLTRFQAYPPLAIGWDFKLVRTSSAAVLWAADELVDAGDRAEAARAVNYANQGSPQPFWVKKDDIILTSPLRFGQYSLNSVIATMPGR
jgi:hypothetical protein